MKKHLNQEIPHENLVQTEQSLREWKKFIKAEIREFI